MRDYKTEPQIWDSKEGCEHDWTERKRLMHNGRGDAQKSAKYSEQENITDFAIESSFCRKCGAWKGELGLEPDFQFYIKHLCNIFDEIKRVLKKTGTVWVNLGDTYGGSRMGVSYAIQIKGPNSCITDELLSAMPKVGHSRGIYDKSLLLIPFRFALEMVNRGWILRNLLIWHKPNCLPSSVKDRMTVDYEPVFFFVKNKKYYFEQQYESHKRDFSNEGGGWKNGKFKPKNTAWMNDELMKRGKDLEFHFNPLGRNKRCVWTIPTHPFSGSHFAVFPEALIEPMIKAGCPRYVCKKCGKPRESIKDFQNYDATKILEERAVGGAQKQTLKIWNEWKLKYPSKGYADFYREYSSKKISKYQGMKWQKGIENKDTSWGNYSSYLSMPKPEEVIVGYSDCGCNVLWGSGIVLDPFAGSGTTGVVAKKLGRNFILIEIKPEYCIMAEKRLKNCLR